MRQKLQGIKFVDTRRNSAGSSIDAALLREHCCPYGHVGMPPLRARYLCIGNVVSCSLMKSVKKTKKIHLKALLSV
jgi:hypothetical protein